MNKRVIATTEIESLSFWDKLNANLIYRSLEQGGAYIFKNRWGQRGIVSSEELIHFLGLAEQWSKQFDLSYNSL